MLRDLGNKALPQLDTTDQCLCVLFAMMSSWARTAFLFAFSSQEKSSHMFVWAYRVVKTQKVQIEDSSETPATPHIIQQCSLEGGSVLRLGGQQFFFPERGFFPLKILIIFGQVRLFSPKILELANIF